MHSAVLQNEDYIKFADKNTVEVISLGGLDQGIAKKDKKAGTYTKTINGQDVELMVEFPNLTADEINALNASEASKYNDTGKIPFTCLVDPHTLEEIHRFPSASTGAIMKAVKDATKTLKKEHGAGVARKDIQALNDGVAKAQAATGAGEFSAAVDVLEKLDKSAKDWPQEMQARLTTVRAEVVQAAEKRFAEVEALSGTDPVAAASELGKLRAKLKGTGLETKASELAEALKGA